jgi:hypothetical protein
MAVVLVRALGLGPITVPRAPFDDTAGHWAEGYINQLWELEITSGCTETSFCPDDPTLRDAAAVFVVRALGETPSSLPIDHYFDDLAESSWTAPYINRLRTLGIVNGCTPDGRSYCPRDPLDRSAMASLIGRAFLCL